MSIHNAEGLTNPIFIFNYIEWPRMPHYGDPKGCSANRRVVRGAGMVMREAPTTLNEIALTYIIYNYPIRRDASSGKTGLELIIQFIAKLLDPSQTESAALFVGDLISKLIKKGGDLVSPILPD